MIALSGRLLNLLVKLIVMFALVTSIPLAVGQNWTLPAPPPAAKGAWSDQSLSPDQRADLLIEQMTLEEKITLVHAGAGDLPKWLGEGDFIRGIPRLGIPDLQ